jgi:hypothetical protein
MKRITKKEVEQLQKTWMGCLSLVRGELEGMQVGEMRLMTKEEWTLPTAD